MMINKHTQFANEQYNLKYLITPALFAILFYALPVSVQAACSDPSATGRFVASASSVCTSNLSAFQPNNGNQNAVSVVSATGTLTAPTVEIRTVGTSDRTIDLNNNASFTVEGNANVFHSKPAGTQGVGALTLRGNSTALFRGFLNITSSSYAIQAAGGSSATVIGDYAGTSERDNIRAEALGSLIYLQGQNVKIDTTGNGARGIYAQNGAGVVIAPSGLVLPTDGSSRIIANNQQINITTSGNQANAVQARTNTGNAIIDWTGGTLTTSGDNSEGVYALVNGGDGDSVVSIDNVKISTTGNNSDGVVGAVSDSGLLSSIPGSSTVVMKSGSISTSGDGSAGLIAQTDLDLFNRSPGNASVTMHSGTISTSGTGAGMWGIDGSHGIFAGTTGTGSSSVDQVGGTISTSGTSAHGVYGVSNLGNVSLTTGAASDVTASGSNADAIRATLVTDAGSFAVNTAGRANGGSGSASGIATNGLQGTIDIAETAYITAQSGVAIRNHGSLSSDPNTSTVQIRTSGTIVGDILTVDGNDRIDFLSPSNTTGTTSTGLGDDEISSASSSVITGDIITGLGDDTLTLGGALAGNIEMSDGDDQLELTSTSITAGQIKMDNGTSDGSDNALVKAGANIDQVSLFDGGDNVYVDDGLVDTLTFQGGRYSLAANSLLNWEKIDLLSATNMTLSSGTLHTGSGTYNGENLGYNIESGAQLSVSSGQIEIIGDLHNSGTISMLNSQAGDALKITADSLVTSGPSGQYYGLGGTILIDTVLGDSSSPTDKLIIDGGAVHGTTGLSINNIGGTGAQTTGDGILLVDAINGATTATGSFYLTDPVAAGAYDYLLYQGANDPTKDYNWYLRSSRLPRPEVIGNLLVSSLAYDAANTELGTFHERTGGRSIIGALSPEQTPAWFRTFGSRQSINQTGAAPNGHSIDADFSGNLFGAQIGVDILGFETNGGNIHRFGAFGSYSHTSGDVDGTGSVARAALSDKVSLNAKSIGAYYTVMTPENVYLDLVAMHSWLDGTTHSSRGISSDISGNATLLSAEVGGAYNLSSEWIVKPQAQLIWQHISIDDSYDRFSAISYEDDSSLMGRLGVRVEKQNTDANSTLYGSVDLWHKFGSSKNSVTFDTDRFTNSVDKTSIKLAIGATYKFSEQVSGFAEGNFKHGLSGNDSHSFGGQVGLRVKF